MSTGTPTNTKRFVPITQPRFPKGYISLLSGSRIPNDALATTLNYWLEQDAVPRIRPPFMSYGSAYANPCVGLGTFTKWVSGAPVRYEISMQTLTQSEMQTLSISGSPTGGTFTLTFGGQTTTTIPSNASATTVQGALQALSSIGAGNIQASGGPLPGSPIVLNFGIGTLKNAQQALITANSSGLTGGTSPQAVITETQVGGTHGFLFTRKDGGSWTQVTGSDYYYHPTGWVIFAQGAQVNTSDTEDQRVYVVNGVDNLSYYDINSNSVVTYAGLATPTISTVTPTAGLAGSTYDQYYRVTGNNAGGESAASASVSAAISTARDYWTSSQSITVSWGAISGATSYNVYTSDQSGQESYLGTVNGTSFVDNGSIAINVFKLAPNNDSSAGPVLSNIVNIDNQLYGVGDINNPQYLWYSGFGQNFGNFSFNPNGGGYVGIDYGGNTIPTVVFPFHDGKGNPVPSILTSGPAGRGKLYHLSQTQQTVGNTTFSYYNVYEANAQDGCASYRGAAVYNNNAYYLTGLAAKTTGTKADVVNILATDTVSDQILNDMQRLNQGALSGYVSLEFLGKIFFAVPTGSSSVNNEIWILDMTRGGLWILPWQLADGSGVKHMWLYEDNNNVPHFLILTTNNVCLELDINRTSTPHQDNGTAFTAILGSGAMVFDAGGVAEVSSYFTYFKYLNPLGTRQESIYGLDETNDYRLLASNPVDIPASSSRLIWGAILYSNPNASSVFSANKQTIGSPGAVSSVAPATYTDPVEVDEIVSEQEWQIVSNTAGTDHLLSSVTTTVYSIPHQYAGNQ